VTRSLLVSRSTLIATMVLVADVILVNQKAAYFGPVIKVSCRYIGASLYGTENGDSEP
jgi:hypothetical protein